MRKYKPLRKHLQTDGSVILRLTFEKINDITGFDIDHSFLTDKKKAGPFGYQVGKISMKEKFV